MDVVQKAALVSIDETQDTIILNAPIYTIGRAQTNTLILRDFAVSRCHCVFKYKDSAWFFTDLSSNGCGINNEAAVLHTNPLKSDDLIFLTDTLKYKFVYPYTPNKKRKHDEKNENTNLVHAPTNNNAQCSKDVAILREQLNEENKSKIHLEKENQNLKDSLAELKSLMTNVDKTNLNLQGQILELQARYDNVVIEREAVQKQLDALQNQAELLDSKLQQSAANVEEFNATQEADRTLMICALKVEIIDKEDSIKDKFKKIFDSTSDTSREHIQTILNELKNDIDQLSLKRKELTIFTTSNSSKLTTPNIAEDLTKLLEADMICSICNEYLIHASAINCGHMFCKTCVTKWSHRKTTCPCCREPFTVISPCKAIDNFLDQIIETWLPDKLEIRNSLKASYTTELPELPRFLRAPALRDDLADDNSSVSVESISSESEGDSVVSIDDSIYIPMRGNRSFGRCFNCGAIGHWANACPNRYGNR